MSSSLTGAAPLPGAAARSGGRRPPPPGINLVTAQDWLRYRRYALTPAMIERATAARLAGDWRAAGASVRVDISVDLADVARDQGGPVAEQIEDDLRHLAPDLLRWHVRGEWARLTTTWGWGVELARYRSAGQPEVALCLVRPALRTWFELTVGPAGRYHGHESLVLVRHLWDVRHAHRLRTWFDGGPVAESAELVRQLLEQGEPVAAFDHAGLDLDPASPLAAVSCSRVAPFQLVPAALSVLPERAGVVLAYPDSLFNVGQVLRLEFGGPRPQVSVVGRSDEHGDLPVLSRFQWGRSIDSDLLRTGWLTVPDLHPALRSEFLPGSAPEPRRPGAKVARRHRVAQGLLTDARVPCVEATHRIGSRDGQLTTLDHSPEEVAREAAMTVFTGTAFGCFDAIARWRSGGPLRGKLGRLRSLALAVVEFGDTDGLLALLDAGLDVGLRDPEGRTLMHLLPLVDRDGDRVLPRLLTAGASLHWLDDTGNTPLHTALRDGGSAALVSALLAHGADPAAVNARGSSPVGCLRLRDPRQYRPILRALMAAHR